METWLAARVEEVTEPRRPQVLVVGLGPAGPDLRTQAASQVLTSQHPIFLRTSWHPGTSELLNAPETSSFDSYYDEAENFEEVYLRIVETLVRAAEEHGQIVYAVPGSPYVGEKTVELLRDDPRIEIDVVAGLSFCDLAWDRLGVDPLAQRVRLIDATQFRLNAAGDIGPMLVGQCWSPAILSEIKLSPDLAEMTELPSVTLLHRLGLPDEQIVTVPWDRLDSAIEPDHLTTLWIPKMPTSVAMELVALDELVGTLRERCPWDRMQTHASLRRHLLEETYEVLDVLDRLDTSVLPRYAQNDEPEVADAGGSTARDLEEELGDLLFQVYFHSRLAAEEGWFTLADVAEGVRTKLVARHPHVFGDVEAATAGAVIANWETIKKAEKRRSSVTDGIPAGLPALALAAKLQRKAEPILELTRPSVDDDLLKILELVSDLRLGAADDSSEAGLEGALGGLLWAVSDLVRQAGFEPEDVLRKCASQFADQIRAVESQAQG